MVAEGRDPLHMTFVLLLRGVDLSVGSIMYLVAVTTDLHL